MNRSRPTVADIRANKGKRQMTMVHIENREEARACAAAGIDVLSIETPIWDAGMREAAGDVFVQVGLQYGALQTTDDYLRAAHDAMRIGGDCCYCAASTQIVERLSQEGVPIVGHVGLIPARRTWTGGFKAVGKTLDTAKLVYQQVKALEDAGAFAAEIEVVPALITEEIAKRTSLVLFSMGAGTGGDAQYLFSTDILGYSDWWTPRHSKQYRDFRAEYARLQAEREGAFSEFVSRRHERRVPAARARRAGRRRRTRRVRRLSRLARLTHLPRPEHEPESQRRGLRMSTSTLTIGLLGAGRIGKVHAAAIAGTPGARLVAVADALPESAASLAAAYGAKVASIDEIIGDADVDAVFITTPTDIHADLIEQAAVAGKAIFCEKPIDLSVERVRLCLAVVAERKARD